MMHYTGTEEPWWIFLVWKYHNCGSNCAQWVKTKCIFSGGDFPYHKKWPKIQINITLAFTFGHWKLHLRNTIKLWPVYLLGKWPNMHFVLSHCAYIWQDGDGVWWSVAPLLWSVSRTNIYWASILQLHTTATIGTSNLDCPSPSPVPMV